MTKWVAMRNTCVLVSLSDQSNLPITLGGVWRAVLDHRYTV
jgi:hypothetical protein